MRSESEDELTEETKARPDVPERTLEEKIEELIFETAETLMDDLNVAAQEEIERYFPWRSSELTKALDELDQRIEELLVAAYGTNIDCRQYGARAKECVHAIFLPFYCARRRHATAVEDFVGVIESLDEDAYTDASEALERDAKTAAQHISLMLAAEPESV